MHQKTSKNIWSDRLAIFKLDLPIKVRVALSKATLLFVITVPIILFLLPLDFFDHGKPFCLSRLLFDMECYGCGLTRACKHLMHLDYERAFYYNISSFIVLPIIGILWIKWGIQECRFLATYSKATNTVIRKS